ncbi:MAG TPA: glycoside hydrolase family 38 C-terminal domain-containing protein [Terriglobia bacterium]|nr:glycoside hydrolase family 38 C-terminal domain-containing protein [Terriglobia bacterium]
MNYNIDAMIEKDSVDRQRFTRRNFLAALFSSPLLFLETNRSSLIGRTVFIVPNFHPASCGWLTTFSKERVYCANSYFDHLDRVHDDPQYAFVLSEVNNLIAMMNFHPERMEELRQRIKEGRVELVNGFFLESTVNLSGGEALVRIGVEGLRWQKEVFGVRPNFAWTIDVCGTHDQMAQIASGLGLRAMVYTRKNPTGSSIHWTESPNGTRILSLAGGHYSELEPVMATRESLTDGQLQEVERFLEERVGKTPDDLPIIILAGAGDYALAPARKQYPSEFLRQWQTFAPKTKLRFTTAGKYLDAILPGLRAERIKLPTLRGGTAYDFDAFWIQCPKVKGRFRKNEHALQAAEILATAASLNTHYEYPVQTLYSAWLQMFLNMDRNTLWGAAGGMVFEDEKSWDVKDRFDWVETNVGKILEASGRSLLSEGEGLGFFNPLNWTRNDPFILPSSEGERLEGVSCQSMPDGTVLCRTDLPPTSVGSWKLSAKAVFSSRETDLPDVIETQHYQAKVDPKTGALLSLRLKSTGREMFGAPANVLVAEKPSQQTGDAGDQMQPRPARTRLDSTSDHSHTIRAQDGPLATTVEINGEFFGGASCRRLVRFYKDYPRIDFESELNDIPDGTVVLAEFPLAESILEVRRGIPYGFSHGSWEQPNPKLHGWTKGIVPAVRWSHYALAGGGGVAILDRGLTGRELNGRTPILYFLNALDKYYGYPNSWLSGKGTHHLEYAIVAHQEDWSDARIARMAWEYDCPPVLFPRSKPSPPRSFLRTSDNVIVEAIRREGRDIELRLVESLGITGKAEVSLFLPHRSASLTNLLGENARPLEGKPHYRFPIRAQEIVTLRLVTDSAVAAIKPLLKWDDLVPEHKRPALHEYSQEKGHPPHGS